MPRGNPSPKLAITIDPDVHQDILAAAARDGLSISAWMTRAARETLRRQAGLAAIARWEKQHGAFTADEMQEDRRRVRAKPSLLPAESATGSKEGLDNTK